MYVAMIKDGMWAVVENGVVNSPDIISRDAVCRQVNIDKCPVERGRRRDPKHDMVMQ